MFLRDPVQAPKHNWKDLVDVLLDEAENVLIIPEVERSFCNLPEQCYSVADIKGVFLPVPPIKKAALIFALAALKKINDFLVSSNPEPT